MAESNGEDREFQSAATTINLDWCKYNESWEIKLHTRMGGKYKSVIDIKIDDGMDKERNKRAIKLVFDELSSILLSEVNRKALFCPLAEEPDKVSYEL